MATFANSESIVLQRENSGGLPLLNNNQKYLGVSNASQSALKSGETSQKPTTLQRTKTRSNIISRTSSPDRHLYRKPTMKATKKPLKPVVPQEDLSEDLKPEMSLLYLPREALPELPTSGVCASHRSLQGPPSQASSSNRPLFLPFEDIQHTEGYLKKKSLLNRGRPFKGVCNSLSYNDSQKNKYLHIVNTNRSFNYSQVVEELSEWNNKKFNRVKVIKR